MSTAYSVITNRILMIPVASEFDRSSLEDSQYGTSESLGADSLDIYRFLSTFEEAQKLVRGVKIYLLVVVKYETSNACSRFSN